MRAEKRDSEKFISWAHTQYSEDNEFQFVIPHEIVLSWFFIEG